MFAGRSLAHAKRGGPGRSLAQRVDVCVAFERANTALFRGGNEIDKFARGRLYRSAIVLDDRDQRPEFGQFLARNLPRVGVGK